MKATTMPEMIIIIFQCINPKRKISIWQSCKVFRGLCGSGRTRRNRMSASVGRGRDPTPTDNLLVWGHHGIEHRMWRDRQLDRLPSTSTATHSTRNGIIQGFCVFASPESDFPAGLQVAGLIRGSAFVQPSGEAKAQKCKNPPGRAGLTSGRGRGNSVHQHH